MNKSLLIVALLAFGASCTPDPAPPNRSGAATATSSPDSSFAAVQERGKGVMGVDQYSSQHVFEDLPTGGRIILERNDSTDAGAIETIRAHMREIQGDFNTGNFAKPFAVHAQQVPGTDVMSTQRAQLRYDVIDRPRGAELVISSTDSAVVAAVHAFLAFQRMDHHAAGHEGHQM